MQRIDDDDENIDDAEEEGSYTSNSLYAKSLLSSMI